MKNFSIAPWKAAYSYSHEYVRDIKDAQGELIAQICDLEKESDESTANARLIAAAPDLLAALSWFISELSDDSAIDMSKLINEMETRARAAIAKATN